MTTAVANPSYYNHFPRSDWPPRNGVHAALNNMSADEVSRILVPRKSAQRSNSTSSISSLNSTSSASTITQSTQVNGLPNGESSWIIRKKPARALWPTSKSEPVSGLSTARTQSSPASSNGLSAAATAISALQLPANPSSAPQTVNQTSLPVNGITRSQGAQDATAILQLTSLNRTFEPKRISIPFSPDVLRIGRQTNQKTVPTALNGYFDSKVLSRAHAEVWADKEGKIWIRDVKSSNGTFVNNKRLSQESKESEPHLLRSQDILELGIDIVSEDQRTVVHHKVAARVDFAGLGEINGALPTGLISDPELGDERQIPLPQRGRTSSHGSVGSNGRLGALNGNNSSNPLPTAAYHAKWLQPVTIEQVVKKINSELRQARGQAHAMHHVNGYMNAVIADEQPPNHYTQESSPTDGHEGTKAHFFWEPPVPPPFQPLPDLPADGASAALSVNPGLLKRSETEKPTWTEQSTLESMVDESEPQSRILNLVEALKSAQEQINVQSEKLREMETALQKEREERQVAEERAQKLEYGGVSLQDVNSLVENISGTTSESGQIDTSKLQTRIDMLLTELNETKLRMEEYKQRTSDAENENKQSRQTLAEMVEAIKRRNSTQIRRRQRKKSASQVDTDGTSGSAGDGEHASGDEQDEELNNEIAKAEAHLNGVPLEYSHHKHLTNGTLISPPSIAELQRLGRDALENAFTSQNYRSSGVQSQAGQDTVQLSETTFVRAQNHIAQTAPYASMIGVVLLGVGIMVYLNGWQRVVER